MPDSIHACDWDFPDVSQYSWYVLVIERTLVLTVNMFFFFIFVIRTYWFTNMVSDWVAETWVKTTFVVLHLKLHYVKKTRAQKTHHKQIKQIGFPFTIVVPWFWTTFLLFLPSLPFSALSFPIRTTGCLASCYFYCFYTTQTKHLSGTTVYDFLLNNSTETEVTSSKIPALVLKYLVYN